jgi:diguanylate cyclase (GGDEF)-like protein
MLIAKPFSANISKSRVAAAATLFVLLVCLILVGISAWSAWNARQVQLYELETETQNISRSLAQHADDAFKKADTAILGLTERIAVDGTSPKALERLHRLLVMRVQELPELHAIFIFDKDGRTLANSKEKQDVDSNNADREYFAFHKTRSDLGPYVGAPVRSRNNGMWIIPLSRRLNDVDGHFAGVVLATLSLDYFNAFYAEYDIGHDGAILLALNRGIQLVRWPMLPNSVGRDVSTGPLFATYAQHGESGRATFISPGDGVERLVAYNRLPHYPVLVSAALSKDEVLAEWRRATLVQGVIIAFIVLVLGYLGFRLVEQITLRTTAEEEARHTGEALLGLNRTLEKLAMQDGLTGLANRRQFDTALQNELSRATRSASSLALIMIDVDHFKKYNDIYGHLAGDECLRQISRVIQSAEGRSGDLAARYGGEEFALLLPSTDVSGALKVAEDIRKTIHELKIRHDGNFKGVVTISAGVNALEPVTDADTPASLIRVADEALYAAKSSGRDQSRALNAEKKVLKASG